MSTRLADKEEMEEWLEKVNTVSAQIQDILNDKVDIDQLENTADKKAAEKAKAREAKRQREEEEKRQKTLRGRDGGGEKENYLSFCRKCRVEYVVEMPKCTRCQQDTVSQAERREELKGLVEKYKEAKSRKQERKKKWELWQKTQAIFWKKTSTNYEKWEYFTDSEDEFERAEKEAAPVLPENDPGFRAMQDDLNQRAFNRRQRAREAQELKQKANELMKKKMYDRAAQVYSEAIELNRSDKYLWTNRALAYLKQGEFEKAVDDCSKMLEYAEVLEHGYSESLDANFKFFARRAMGHKGLKKYDLALKDIEAALALIPGDASALETRKELEQLAESSKKLEELSQQLGAEDLARRFTAEQLAAKQLADDFLALSSDAGFKRQENKDKLRTFDYFQLRELVKDEDLKLYFLHKHGLKALKRIFKAELYSVTSSDKLNLLPFVQVLCESSPLFQEQMVDSLFVRAALKKILAVLEELFPNNVEKAERTESKEKESVKAEGGPEQSEAAGPDSLEPQMAQTASIDQMFDYKMIELEAIFEMLISLTENRNVRAYLRDKPHLLIPAFKILHENVFPRWAKEFSLLSSVINFYSNLCMTDVGIKSAEIRENFIQHYIPWVCSFSASVLGKNQSKLLTLKNSCLAFVVNLSTDKKFRDHTINLVLTFEGLHKNSANILVAADDFNHTAYFMQNLGICFNILFRKVAEGCYKEHLDAIMKFYEHSTSILINLFFQLTDKSVVSHMQRHFKRWKLDTVCIDILHGILKNKLNVGVLMNRFINVVAKLSFEDSPANNEKVFFIVCETAKLFPESNEENQQFFTDAIRFLASTFQEKKEIGKQALSKSILLNQTFAKHVRNILSKEWKSTMR